MIRDERRHYQVNSPTSSESEIIDSDTILVIELTYTKNYIKH